MKRPFGSGRYANVTSTLALVVALSGTSYAAAKLAPNSVGTPQLKNNAVTTAKVKDGTLLATDFKAGVIKPGKDGAQGAAGPAGKDGTPGATGPAGKDGAPGATGPAGAKGDTGAKGDKGNACLSSDPLCRGPNGAAAFSAVTTAPLPFPVSTASITVQSLNLQAGKYIVDGRVSAHDAGLDTTVACSLVAGATVIDSMGGALGIDATATIDAAVSLHGVLTLGAPGTVDLKCNVVDPVAGTYAPRSITAIQVGTLNGV
jgi:hypothetical protein